MKENFCWREFPPWGGIFSERNFRGKKIFAEEDFCGHEKAMIYVLSYLEHRGPIYAL